MERWFTRMTGSKTAQDGDIGARTYMYTKSTANIASAHRNVNGLETSWGMNKT